VQQVGKLARVNLNQLQLPGDRIAERSCMAAQRLARHRLEQTGKSGAARWNPHAAQCGSYLKTIFKDRFDLIMGDSREVLPRMCRANSSDRMPATISRRRKAIF
jgi:hypothetical protein